MGHRIDEVVDANAVGKRGVLFGIVREIGPFPCVAQVHVVADGHLDPAFIVEDGSPFRLNAVPLVGSTRIDELPAGDLDALAKIVKSVKIA